jgi:hypothetical protein
MAAGPGAPRLADPHAQLDEWVVAPLAQIISRAAAALPSGWSVEIVADNPPLGAGARRRTLGPAQAVPYRWLVAVDLRLYDERGRGLATTSASERDAVYRAYRHFADLVFIVQQCRFPDLVERLAWGGKFTTAAGQWNVGHFDLGGWRGRGRYQRPVKRAEGKIAMSWVAADPAAYAGQAVGSGQCVAFVQAAAGVPHTAQWRRGAQVRGGKAAAGTAIATFSRDGRYENRTDGASHAAVLIAEEAGGLRVWDQWKNHVVQRRTIRWKGGQGSANNDADRYYVIEGAPPGA